jgi:hypothetical protein
MVDLSAALRTTTPTNHHHQQHRPVVLRLQMSEDSSVGEVDGGVDQHDGGNDEDDDEDDDDHDDHVSRYGDDDRDYSDVTSRPLFRAIWKKKPLSVMWAVVEQRPESVRATHWGELPLHDAVRHGLSAAHVRYLYGLFPRRRQGHGVLRAPASALH